MPDRRHLRLVQDALRDAAGREISDEEFASLVSAETAAVYLAQGLPGFRGDVPEWSFQSTFHEHYPTLVTRYWWPRLVAPIKRGIGRAQIGFVTWTDDPGEHRERILKHLCEAFMVRMPEE